jgi:hypothetical protein
VLPGLWYDADGHLAREYGWVDGDLNCDGVVDMNDLDAFNLALQGQAAYEAVYPYCNWLNADECGTWSHKRGGTECGDRDAVGCKIGDPRRAERDYPGLSYRTLCGCYCIPKGGIKVGPP